MTAILQFLIITGISAAFVRRIFGRRIPEFDSTGERLIFESALGLGILGLLIFTLGVLQLFYQPAFLGLLLVMAFVSWKELSKVISEAVSALAGIRRLKYNAEGIVTVSVVILIGVFALLRTLAPPTADDWDSLAYHLAIPKLYLQHHSIYYINFSSHSNFPFTWEMLYTLGLAFGSISLAKLFHFGAGLLLIGTVFAFSKRHFDSGTARLAALITSGIPLITWEATTAYIDIASALYSFLVVYSLMNYTATHEKKWALIAGAFAGITAGIKMTALIMLPVTIIWILYYKTAVTRMRTAVITILLAGIIAAPWYIKSFAYTGNPVYPFAYGVFGGKNWNAETAKTYRDDQIKFGKVPGAQSPAMLPWNLTFRFVRYNDYGARFPELSAKDEFSLLSYNRQYYLQVYLSSIGPFLLILIPMLSLAALTPGRHRPLLLVSLVLTGAWYISMQNTRYLLPVLALLAPAIAYSAELIRARKAVFTAAVISAVFTAFLIGAFALPSARAAVGLQKPEDYLKNFNLFNACSFINDEIPENAKIAMFGETRGFYINREYLWADSGHNAIIPYSSFDDEPARLIEWLKGHGYDYVLINHQSFPPDSSSLILKAVGQGLEKIYPTDDPSQPIGIYHISIYNLHHYSAAPLRYYEPPVISKD